MSNAITKTNGNGAAGATDIMAYAGDLTREQVDLIKATVAKGTSDQELAFFLTVSKRRGLDPFSGQIYAIVRNTYNPDTRTKEPKMTIQVGVDGYRLLAEKTGKYEGLAGQHWCGEDGVWRDVWLSDKPPAAAKVGVYRAGCREPFWGVCTFREYAQTYDGAPTGKWKDMPANQLAKCAEVQAIRKAFPQAVAGLTTPETVGADTETYEITEGDRAQARILEDRRAAQEARGRQPWVEEIDAAVEGIARPAAEHQPATGAPSYARAIAIAGAALDDMVDDVMDTVTRPAAPDVVLEAIAAAGTVAALEAVARRDDYDPACHQSAADARTVEITSKALDNLDWSQPAAVERRLKVAAIKLDRMTAEVPGWNLAIDKLEAARQQLADISRVAAA